MVRVGCQDCGHDWDYTGDKIIGKPYNYVKCSQCGSSDIVKLDGRVQIVDGAEVTFWVEKLDNGKYRARYGAEGKWWWASTPAEAIRKAANGIGYHDVMEEMDTHE